VGAAPAAHTPCMVLLLAVQSAAFGAELFEIQSKGTAVEQHKHVSAIHPLPLLPLLVAWGCS
jgi:hypothetical protein